MALSREITLTIDNYNITLDKEIKIYEYDAINLCFTIQECGIVMRDGKAHNRVMPVVALKAYMLIETPQGTDSVEATNIVRNKIMFSLGNKYSRFVGTGKMQIILKDFDGCRITLPEFNYEVKQSINTGWDDGSFDVLITEKEDTIITDELGRPIETTKISEMDEVNEITPQTYTMVINEDGNKKIKLDTMMESISEMIEFDAEEIDRRIDEMIEVYDDEEVEVEFPSLHNDVERIKGEINEISESLDNMKKHQHIKRETGSIPNNVYDNTSLIVEKEYNGFNNSSNVFEGSSIHAITTANNNSGKVQGTIHGITSQVIYRDMGGDNKSELTPLFLDCNSESGGSLWGLDLNVNAPFPHNEKAYRILGQAIRMSNYHDNTVDGSAGLSVVTIPGTGGAGEDRCGYESKPIDVGIAITGYSGKNDLSITDVGFKTGLQIGGRVTGWQPQGGNSEIGTAIEISQFKQGILVKNIPLGTPLLTVKDCYTDSNNIELINYSGAVQFIGEDSSKQLLTLYKNGEVNIANSITLNRDGIPSFKKNNVANMEISEGLNYIDITFQNPINDLYYNVFIELNWLTTYRVINKTNVGFRIEFGTPSVIGSRIGYFAVAN